VDPRAFLASLDAEDELVHVRDLPARANEPGPFPEDVPELIRQRLALVGVTGLFATLYPNVMPSSTDAAYSLTVDNASSTDYTLKVMTVVALAITPVVLCYQVWTYWVFRKRISNNHIPAAQSLVPAARSSAEPSGTTAS